MKHIYFIGIGGIGMSAIARYYNAKGYKVSGYDKTPSPLTHALESEGIDVHYTDDISYIPADVENTLVVYTPAIPKDMGELVHVQTHGYRVVKRSRMLGEIAQGQRCMAVAGTHGKTTTSTLVSHLFTASGAGCSAFLGGISKNYDSNLLIHANDVVVAEADEFDRSFHWLTPYATIITATDADHLDIYGTEEAYLESFSHYTSLIQPGGYLVMRHGINLQPRLQEGVKLYTYSTDEGDFHAENIRIGGGEIVFDYVSPLGNIQDVQLGVPVAINIENGIAAMALAQISGGTNEEIKAGMASFHVIERRFDFKLKTDRVVYLSDYAHHPEEIRQSILSMRALYADKKLTAVFQPHLYTRTRDFHQEFADALSLLDEVILTDIYPARELPIEGVSSRLIYDRLRPDMEKTLCKKEEVLDLLKDKSIEVLITLGAGDIEDYAPRICEILDGRC